jgi:glycosyltransferase involved in cell wall biosynthesis
VSKTPIVSVVSISYNQEKYIRETLESFVAQQTNFHFEIVIADDCSTDKTPEIIREFVKAYPDMFRPILRKENVGVQANLITALQVSRGKYIALCEGDDYWTDPEKLQRQVDFMESNPSYALCFHPVKVVFEDGSKKDYVFPGADRKTNFTEEQLFRQNFIQTNSVMYRRQDYGSVPADILPLDWYLHLYHAQFGKIGFIDKVMASYRRHPNGIWWNSDKNIDEIWKKYGLAHLGLYVEVKKLVDGQGETQKVIDGHINRMWNVLIETDQQYKTELLEQAIKKYPAAAEVFMTSDYSQIQEMDSAAAQRDKTLQAQQREIARQEQLVKERDQLLRMIRNSRTWRLRNKLANRLGRGSV